MYIFDISQCKQKRLQTDLRTQHSAPQCDSQFMSPPKKQYLTLVIQREKTEHD